jgi:PRC-barrel domain
LINNSNIGGMSGAPVHGPDDRKIGTVGQVFLDPDTGMPNWITVHTGLFGRRESFVPLDGATWDNEVIRVAIDKDIIKDAPRMDAEEPLTPENEGALYRYYTRHRTDASTGDGGAATTATAGHDDAPASSRSRLRPYQQSGRDTAAPAPAADADRVEPADSGPSLTTDESHANTIHDSTAGTGADTGTDTDTDTGPDTGTGARAVPDATQTPQPRGRHARDD